MISNLFFIKIKTVKKFVLTYSILIVGGMRLEEKRVYHRVTTYPIKESHYWLKLRTPTISVLQY